MLQFLIFLNILYILFIYVINISFVHPSDFSPTSTHIGIIGTFDWKL